MKMEYKLVLLVGEKVRFDMIILLLLAHNDCIITNTIDCISFEKVVRTKTIQGSTLV
jgi:hypothetical protein